MEHHIAGLSTSSPLLGVPIGRYLYRQWDRIVASDYTGFDPGTLYYQPWYLALLVKERGAVSLPIRIWNAAIQRSFRLGGYALARAVNPPAVNSTKAIALNLSAAAWLLRACPNSEETRHRGEALMQHLLARRTQGAVWQPDFDYRIRGTTVVRNGVYPCAINTAFAAYALWDWHSVTREEAAGRAVVEAAVGLEQYLPRIEADSVACFTYHPDVEYYVHNANVLIAAVLTRAASLAPDRAPLAALAAKCVRYTLADIDRTGLVPYGGPETRNWTVDNFHTGYVARALDDIRQVGNIYLDPESLRSCIDSILETYVSTFVSTEGVFHYPGRRGIQTHSLAEALLLYAQFSAEFPEHFGSPFTEGVRKSFHELWDGRRGYFINEIHLLPLGFRRRDVTPMPRWSWSWMVFALARVAEFEYSRGAT